VVEPMSEADEDTLAAEDLPAAAEL
jgi:hypothetical protein